MLQQNGITITELTNIGSNIAANSVLPIVNLVSDETQKTSVALLGNYILNAIAPNTTVNLGNISNITITGGSNGYVLHTHGNGELYWDIDDDAFPGGPNTAVQFNDNNEFGGSNNFTFNSASNTLTINGSIVTGNLTANNITGNIGNLTVGNITADNIDANTLTVGNIHVASVGNGTSQQVLGIVNQDTQQLGWKTIPVYYITVGLRNGNTYLSSPNAVLRVYPVGQRNGTYMDTNTVQI
jgi:hypothetical protein